MSRRLLLVAPFVPRRDGPHGGARVVYGLAAALAERHDLVLVHLDSGEGTVDSDLEARCAAVYPVAAPRPLAWTRRPRYGAAVLRGRSLRAAEWGVPQLRRRVHELCASLGPEVVQVEFAAIGDVLRAAGGALRVLTVHDPAASIREGLPLRPPGLPLVHRLDARAALREERRALRLADGVVAFTERDRRLLAAYAVPDVETVTIPLGGDIPPVALDPGASEPPVLVFVGNFNHPPNVDAAVRLVRAIFPRVRAAYADAELELVGAMPTQAVSELAGPGVRVTGAVMSVTPHLERATLVLAPLTIGGGMRVKVLEALAAGKAVVASSRAADGLTAVPGRDLMVADGDEHTAMCIIRMIDDDAGRRAMAANARRWAERELSWRTMADRYDELYARLERRARA